jgi:uncharacterized protein (TIGR03790 family)
MPVRLRLAAILALVLGAAGPAAAQTGANVLIVYTKRAPAAAGLAAAYARARGVSDAQQVALDVRTVDEVSAFEFERDIQTPIRQWIAAHDAQDRILYLVLVKGIPVRIAGSGGRTGTRASVDSELTLLYRRMTGKGVPLGGPLENPYYARNAAAGAPPRFSHRTQDIYLVTRLDGFTPDDVRGLIERGSKATNSGRFLFDQRPGFDRANDWLAAAAERLNEQGLTDRVTLERSGTALEHQKDVLGYFSWGSNDPALTARAPDLSFVPGALVGLFLSTDARTFSEPPASWKPSPDNRPSTQFAGTAQALVADYVRAGATGASGQVSEPFLDGAVRPDILFPAYASGLNLAESYYRAIPSLSWQTVVVGDPLCAPVQGVPVSPVDLDPAKDPATELPAFFAARRVAEVSAKGGRPEAITALVRGEGRQARGDLDGARAALEEAVAADPSIVAAWQTLAVVYDSTNAFDKANEVYRRLLAGNPKDVVALNNLAYNLGVRGTERDEAVTLAERAQLLAPANPSVLDTLGWIRHLRGDHEGALKALVPAAKLASEDAEIQLHAAIAMAAGGYMREATQALDRAQALSPSIVETPAFQDAAKKIRTPAR